MPTYYGFNWGILAAHSYYQLDASGKKFSHRFTAAASKTVAQVKVYAVIGGTSPTYTIGVQGDNGGVPDGSYVGSVNQQLASGWNLCNISDCALTQGTVYHLVIQYSSGIIDGSNYARIYRRPTASTLRPFDLSTDANYNTLHDDGDAVWDLEGYTPEFILYYSDATYEGQPFTDVINTSVYGTRYYGEQFVAPAAKTVSHIGFRMRTVLSPAALYVSIYNVTDGVYVVDSEQVTEGVGAAYAWVDHALSASQSLASGKTYQVWVESPLSDSSNRYELHLERTQDTTGGQATWNGASDKYAYTNVGTVPLENTLVEYDHLFRFTEAAGGLSIPVAMRSYRNMRL